MAIPSNQNQRKKKKGSGLWGLFVLFVIYAINRLDAEKVSRFFSRLKWSFRTGRINSRAAISAIAVVVALFLLIVIIGVVAKKAREKRFDGVRTRRGGAAGVSPMSSQSVQHSHDRLQGYHGEESGADHWKKQLDGFLEAGIIDRSEYKALLERRRR